MVDPSTTVRVAREQVLSACQLLTARGLLVGTGGNVSVRADGTDRFAITPSSTDYVGMTAEDLCVMDLVPQLVEGRHPPSVESGMHAAVYRARPDVNAVIHTHQPYASALALIDGGVPALFDEQVLNLGEGVELVPYGLSGSEPLIEHITTHLANQCNAYLLQNHGALVLGLTVELAVRNVLLLEKCAQTYTVALHTGRTITHLPAESVSALAGMLRSAQRKEARRKERLARLGEAPPPSGALSEKT